VSERLGKSWGCTGSLGVCPTPRGPAASGFTRMLSGSAAPSVTRTAFDPAQRPAQPPQGQNLSLPVVAQDVDHGDGESTLSAVASTSWGASTSLAGFQVSTTGRFWVSTEDLRSPTNHGTRAKHRQDGLTTAKHEELRRLRREHRVLREEREILKSDPGPGRPSQHESRLSSRCAPSGSVVRHGIAESARKLTWDRFGATHCCS